VIELRKKVALKIAIGSVFVCSFILALMYPVISARYMGKIHFLMSPKAGANFIPPAGKEANTMIVWVGMFKDSTYGSFKMAMVGYETYHGDDQHWEYHWFTDNLRAGEVYGYVSKKAYPSWEGIPLYFEYDVTLARININTSEHQLNATIIVKGTTLFTAQFRADTTTPIESYIEPSQVSHELYLSVDARRPLLSAKVTGLEVGAFSGGVFVYIDTELCDSSLLP